MSGTTSRRLAGVVSFTVDGVSYDVANECNYNPSSVKRETKAGQTAVSGYSEMPQAGFIAATLFTVAGISPKAFNALTASTVLVQAANGTTVSGNGMWSTEIGDVNTGEGTFSVRFEGPEVYEDVAA